MEILQRQPTSKAPADWFTGDVWWDVVYAGQEPSRMRVNLVRFSPCARTDWHSHAMGQTLHIVSGVALIQSRGGRIIEARPGDTVHTPPGEEHWHGAAPDSFMEHLALWEGLGPDGGPETVWGDKVTDAEYQAPHAVHSATRDVNGES
ncbi:cupin domain-containing protein [Streptosporangium sp. NPDC051023]|uniref:(R)-mandelonitrile lyase n=1 Tax=Streptosporangium sp. NPDC051023 TaxID=3155410 RepID=UPI00344F3895